MVAVDDKGTLQAFYMRYLRVSNPCAYTTGPGIAGQLFTAILTCPAVVLGNGRLEVLRVEATATTKKGAEKQAARKALQELESRGFNVHNPLSSSSQPQQAFSSSPDGFQLAPLQGAHLPQDAPPPALKRGVYRLEDLGNLEPLSFPDLDNHNPSNPLAAVRGNPKGALQELYAKALKSCSGAVMFQWSHFLEGKVFGVTVVCPVVDSSYLTLLQLQGSGTATTKKEAEQNAANAVLKQLEKSYGVYRGAGGAYVIVKQGFTCVL